MLPKNLKNSYQGAEFESDFTLEVRAFIKVSDDYLAQQKS